MDGLISDLRYGLRVLRASPVFAFVTVATLALGIGANTAIFSVVDSVLIRPLPFADPDRVVMVWEDASYVSFPRNTPAPANYYSWKELNRAFTDIAATRGVSANLTTDGQPEQVLGRGVTSNFFSVLGVPPMLGRTFTEDEDKTAAQVTLISYGLWQRRYAGNPAIVGSEITMNGSKRTVIGVMPRGFVFRNRNIDYWVPIQFTPQQVQQRNSHYLNVVARLKPDVTLARAREDMNDVADRLKRDFPASNAQIGAAVVPVKDDALGNTRLELIVLLAASGCVLLIACANIASLLLSRAMSRRSEMAVRAAIGATSGRLIRQMLAEAMILALAGGALGLALAPVGIAVLDAMVPSTIPAPQRAAIDPMLIGFTLLVSAATAVVFGLVPAVHAARATINDTLQRGGRSGIDSRGRTRDALVVAQVAVALVLLVGAGLLLRTLVNLRGTDLGFSPDHMLTLRTTLPAAKYQDPSARLAFYTRVVDGVRALPGVEHAAYVSTLPFQSIGNTNSYRIEGREPVPGQDSLFRAATADYLKTLGVELVEGRMFDERDGRDAPPVVVVNETFARLNFGGESALGHRVSYGATDAPYRTIVGVVKDVRERGYEPEMKAGTYSPYAQWVESWFPEYLAVRTSGDPTALVPGVRRIVSDIDPDQPISSIQTMDDILDLNVVDRTQQATLVGAFAGLALLLASLGLYAVLSYGVAQRRREIGLRIALGANSGSVVGMILKRGIALTLGGLAVGLGLAWAAARAMSALLFGIGANDPATLIGVIGLLLLIAVAASCLPALRAARVDPMEALRQD
jgi:putative ABC transport system permease protein